MKRKPLSKKEIKDLNQKLTKINIEFDKKERIDIIDDKYYLKNNEIIFFVYETELIPTLKFILKNPNTNFQINEAIVDMGAVKFIANGADVMRAGIKEIKNDFKKGDLIIVKDENNLKPLVIGVALNNKDEFEIQKDGKTIKNIHYIGDDIWNLQIK